MKCLKKVAGTEKCEPATGEKPKVVGAINENEVLICDKVEKTSDGQRRLHFKNRGWASLRTKDGATFSLSTAQPALFFVNGTQADGTVVCVCAGVYCAGGWVGGGVRDG